MAFIVAGNDDDDDGAREFKIQYLTRRAGFCFGCCCCFVVDVVILSVMELDSVGSADRIGRGAVVVELMMARALELRGEMF